MELSRGHFWTTWRAQFRAPQVVGFQFPSPITPIHLPFNLSYLRLLPTLQSLLAIVVFILLATGFHNTH